ncbi:hypothetical protein F5B19DRAFT_26596 [Rostrohypoxylon terebratum]|nr:hypothetical protein F5B19DRAFT_26596 [Rostrohypoxylon terebratum]
MADIIQNFPNLPSSVQQQILDGPALAPPSGVKPNFIDPPNRNYEAIAVVVVCLFLSTIAAVGRAYSRTFVTKKVELQDCTYLLRKVYQVLAHLADYLIVLFRSRFTCICMSLECFS